MTRAAARGKVLLCPPKRRELGDAAQTSVKSASAILNRAGARRSECPPSAINCDAAFSAEAIMRIFPILIELVENACNRRKVYNLARFSPRNSPRLCGDPWL